MVLNVVEATGEHSSLWFSFLSRGFKIWIDIVYFKTDWIAIVIVCYSLLASFWISWFHSSFCEGSWSDERFWVWREQCLENSFQGIVLHTPHAQFAGRFGLHGEGWVCMEHLEMR